MKRIDALEKSILADDEEYITVTLHDEIEPRQMSTGEFIEAVKAGRVYEARFPQTPEQEELRMHKSVDALSRLMNLTRGVKDDLPSESEYIKDNFENFFLKATKPITFVKQGKPRYYNGDFIGCPFVKDDGSELKQEEWEKARERGEAGFVVCLDYDPRKEPWWQLGLKYGWFAKDD